MVRECGQPRGPYDPVGWNGIVMAVPQSVTDDPRRARPAGQLADQPVRRDAAGWYSPHDRVNPAPPCIRGR